MDYDIQFHQAKFIISILREYHAEAYLAGGCVRDRLLGLEPKDFDIVTSMLPDQIEIILTKYGIKSVAVGKSFGVITAVIGENSYEVATYRADGDYSDGRRPDEIRFVKTLKEDAARRDFTINAMFWDPFTDEIIDYFGGQKDLKNKRLRFVGSAAERIHEDPVRILRALKFSGRYEFWLPEWIKEGDWERAEQFDYIGNYADKLAYVSRERIGAEFKEILCTHYLGGMLDQILKWIIPGIESTWGLLGEQDPKYHAEGNVWQHTVMVVEILRKLAPGNFELLLAGLLHDIGKPATQECCGNRIKNIGHAEVGYRMAQNICAHWLKLSAESTHKVAWLVRHHMTAHDFNKMSNLKLRKWAEEPYIDDLVLLQHADATGRKVADGGSKGSNFEYMTAKLESFRQLPRTQQPNTPSLIMGRHLIELGYRPDPKFKVILADAREAQLAGDFDEHNAQVWLRDYMHKMKYLSLDELERIEKELGDDQ